MLYLLTPFAYLGEYFGGGIFLIKIPLLIADISILIALVKLFPDNENKILIYYFLNPVVIYSTYIHSQLDIIPTALLFLSIYLLTIKKLTLSSIFLGLAIATKVHVVVALPIIAYYIFKNYEKLDFLKYFFLDSSFPMINKLILANEKNIALRFSEFEKIDTILSMSQKVKWVWVDCFSKLPITIKEYKLIKNKKFKLCLVSPELQNQEEKLEKYKEYLKDKSIIFDAICCKLHNVYRWKS